jgi:hypothetical protein
VRFAWLLVIGCALATAAHAGNPPDDVAVRQAIERGIAWLYDQQHEWGTWDVEQPKDEFARTDHPHAQYSGYTALALYAMFSADQSWQGDERLSSALKFLDRARTKGVYALGLRAHVWARLPEMYSGNLARDARALISGVNRDGAYRYLLGDSDFDHSCTQYAVLGVWEAAKRGLGVSGAYWQRVERHFLDEQNADGGWGYGSSRPPSDLSMTAAGLAVLFITQDFLHRHDYLTPGAADRVDLSSRLERGLAWMHQHYQPTEDSYEMVGVERVGLASGYRYFGKQDWYLTGAAKLLSLQETDGSFGAVTQGGRFPQTCFAVVFLSRGRVPVLINKLAVDGLAWNNRPRDVANLTRWFAEQTEQSLNWQVVDASRPPEDWLDAPVVFLASHEAVHLSAAQAAAINCYLDLGGLLVTCADGGSRDFTGSIYDQFSRLYPHYPWRAVEADDPLMRLHHCLDNSLGMRSLHNGVRHLVIHLPRDVGAILQADDHRSDEVWQALSNILLYASELGQLRPRLARHVEPPPPSTARRSIEVAQVRYEGNWNPEPLAWPMLNRVMQNDHGVKLDIQPIDMSKLEQCRAPLAHLAGTGDVEFTSAQIDALKRYVDAGGKLLIESVGGDADFGDSVDTLLAVAFEDVRLMQIGRHSPIVTGELLERGHDVRRVEYRTMHRQRMGVQDRPSLLVWGSAENPRVVISYEDLSHALLGQPCWSVLGYDSKSARHLMCNLVRWADQQHAESE